MSHPSVQLEPIRRPADHLFLTVQETADELGFSRMTIHRRITAGQFPAIKIGSKAMVPRAFVDALVDAAHQGRTVTVDEFAAEWSARVAPAEGRL